MEDHTCKYQTQTGYSLAFLWFCFILTLMCISFLWCRYVLMESHLDLKVTRFKSRLFNILFQKTHDWVLHD